MEPLIDHLLGLIPGDFTFATIKPDGGAHSGEILEMIREAGMSTTLYATTLTEKEVRALYYAHVGKPYYDKNAAHNMSGTVTLMIIEGPDALNWWRTIAMPQIRDRWADKDPNNRPANVVHGSDSPEAAFREAHYFFR